MVHRKTAFAAKACLALLAVATALVSGVVTGDLFGASVPALAPTPPMGWNSWDAYGTTIRESEVKQNADVMASKLKQFGWQYIVVDIQWYEPNAQAHGYRANAKLSLDANGRTVPAVNRFPSAANGQGFKPLADYVHSKGLSFGIHILRGIPRQAVAANAPIAGTALHAGDVADKSSLCRWNTDMYGVDMTKPGAQAYYDSIVAQYAKWGVDFIKADDMSSPYHQAEIEGLHKAIVHSGRPIVLSLSPGPAPLDKVASLRANAQMWRIEDDLWDNWASVKSMYTRMESWLPLVTPGHWPDADMLPLGHIGLRAERGNPRLSLLSHDEQQTLMTAWAMFRSPLMFGGDLPTLDPFTTTLLTNADMLAVNQHSTGNHVALQHGDLRVWTATSKAKAEPGKYIAVFNLGDQAMNSKITLAQLGIVHRNGTVKDLWAGKTFATAGELPVHLAPHASALYSLRQ
ncbi:glycoside hydrolase family 27 protein [Acidipila sp. EB88]|uniref:glycoside hydrolase family 27 protein n=1 Tax=Acidipila sp. EB88 TaxID=2305226 RepID=UPI000F601BCF|nr:glycoside hydrolase family 27 protein [Acidipila sp. EB88]RRA49151.1 glycoside hydrolase family 27 protein [Acidipila sp. EB88]